MTHYTAEQLSAFPWIASCDTLRPEDLLPKFWSVAEICAVLANRPALLNNDTLASLAKLVGEDAKETDWNDEEAAQTLDDLFLALDEVAPAGFHFSASEGDGACFGFWLGDDWHDALEHLGLGDDDPAGWATLIADLVADGIEPDSIEDSYQGRAEGYSEERAGADFAAQLAEDLGILPRPDRVEWPCHCIDWEAAWRELEMGDGYRLHDLGGGDWLVFRNV